jgi:hypothetical protein
VPRRRSEAGTFGSHLQHFVRSVDIVDNQTYIDTRDLISEYLRDELNAANFELNREGTVNSEVGLRTYWSSSGKSLAETIRAADGSYATQIAVSFGTGKPLWVVSADRGPLNTSERYADLWSGLADLPRYRAPLTRDFFTSIILPIRRPNSRAFGVMVIESANYLDIAEFDRQELALLADALSTLLDLRDLHEVQTQGTRDAVRNLRRLREAVVFPQIALPQVFVASPMKADAEVVGVILDVLGKFDDKLRVAPWYRIDDSGIVTAQLADMITTSRFGVCYLSQPDGNGGYTDNLNVTFEAGMLHALALASGPERAGWLPIREEKSPPPPFDFAGDRIEVVPRTSDGRLNEQMFRARLNARLLRLLDG